MNLNRCRGPAETSRVGGDAHRSHTRGPQLPRCRVRGKPVRDQLRRRRHGLLRDAVGASAPGDTITFAPAAKLDPACTTPDTITVQSPILITTDGLTIQGPGAGVLAVSGGDVTTVFQVGVGTSVTVQWFDGA